MLKIASIGDCCVDIYPQQQKFVLGGTAFNRAVWLAQNGAEVSLVSAVGTDTYGQQYLAACRKLKINTEYLAVLPGQTSRVEIILDQDRSPQFSAWQLGVLKNFLPQKWPGRQDALITTGLKPIKQLLSLPTAPFTAADFDGNTPYTFSNAAIKKDAADFDLIIASRRLTVKNHKLVLITMGERGSRIITPKKEYFVPAKTVKTTDTTGAGDVYISSFVLNYLKTKNIFRSMRLATRAAAKAITSPRRLAA
jgi:fructoselysine 6-kinase